MALSGGVDSVLAAALAVERLGRVRACFLDMQGEGAPVEAAAAAGALGIRLEVVEAAAAFELRVAAPSRETWLSGGTPNPCALCNASVKLAIPSGMLGRDEVLVTGHYARAGSPPLRRALSRRKDQSYFLSLVEAETLRRTWLPLGCMRKEEVRRMADARGLPFRERESMDLCFPRPDAPAEHLAVDRDGRPLGTVRAAWPTVGMRASLPGFREPLYVLSTDPGSRTVSVGPAPDLLRTGCMLRGVNRLSGAGEGAFRAEAVLTSGGQPSPALAEWLGGGLRVTFDRPVSAVAGGQVCVLYQSDEVLCAGIVESWEGSAG